MISNQNKSYEVAWIGDVSNTGAFRRFLARECNISSYAYSTVHEAFGHFKRERNYDLVVMADFAPLGGICLPKDVSFDDADGGISADEYILFRIRSVGRAYSAMPIIISSLGEVDARSRHLLLGAGATDVVDILSGSENNGKERMFKSIRKHLGIA